MFSKHYTPVNSYYKLIKAVEDDPELIPKKPKEVAPLCRIPTIMPPRQKAENHG